MTMNDNSTSNNQSSSGNLLRKYSCDGYQDISVENVSTDKVKVADGYGGIHTLSSATSGSGEKYSDGNISIHMKGNDAVYTENGKVWKKYQYKDDQLNGRYSSYYGKTGSQETVGNYENGKMTGTWTEYYENGSKKSQGNYSNGQKNGLFSEWNTNGGKKSEINYVNDEINGKMNVYYESGRPLYEANMNGETGTVRGYYTDGSLGFEGSIKGRRRTGTWTYYDKSGNPRKMNY